MEFLSWARNQWDRVAAWVVAALGGLAIVLGWVGVTDTPYSFEQIPFVVSGGLGGIFLLGVAAMLWISADLRDEWRKLDELAAAIDRATDAAAAAPTATANGSAKRPARAGR